MLKNVGREAISVGELLEVTKRANVLDANSYSEVILGLPGDTKGKHFRTVFTLADAGVKFIPLYTLMLLEGTVLATDEQRRQWEMGSRYRVVPRCFGSYQFGDRQILSAELEEVCVYTNTLPYEDYLECRSLALTMGLFYQDRILFELYGFLGTLGIKPSELLSTLHERRMSLSPSLTDLYRSFDDATASELWEECDELERFTKSSPETIGKYVQGELGNNILFWHRATAFLELIDDIHEVAFRAAAELVREKDESVFHRYREYLDELHAYSANSKRNLFDLSAEFSGAFNYDFRTLLQSDFGTFPRRLDGPRRIRFFPSQEQIEMIRDQLYVQGSDLNGIAKIVSRVPVARLQRTVEFD